MIAPGVSLVDTEVGLLDHAAGRHGADVELHQDVLELVSSRGSCLEFIFRPEIVVGFVEINVGVLGSQQGKRRGAQTAAPWRSRAGSPRLVGADRPGDTVRGGGIRAASVGAQEAGKGRNIVRDEGRVQQDRVLVHQGQGVRQHIPRSGEGLVYRLVYLDLGRQPPHRRRVLGIIVRHAKSVFVLAAEADRIGEDVGPAERRRRGPQDDRSRPTGVDGPHVPAYLLPALAAVRRRGAGEGEPCRQCIDDNRVVDPRRAGVAVGERPGDHLGGHDQALVGRVLADRERRCRIDVDRATQVGGEAFPVDVPVLCPELRELGITRRGQVELDVDFKYSGVARDVPQRGPGQQGSRDVRGHSGGRTGGHALVGRARQQEYADRVDVGSRAAPGVLHDHLGVRRHVLRHQFWRRQQVYLGYRAAVEEQAVVEEAQEGGFLIV